MDGQEEYFIERILSHRQRHGKQQYLVKWLGYPDYDNTWLPQEEVEATQAYDNYISTLDPQTLPTQDFDSTQATEQFQTPVP